MKNCATTPEPCSYCHKAVKPPRAMSGHLCPGWRPRRHAGNPADRTAAIPDKPLEKLSPSWEPGLKEGKPRRQFSRVNSVVANPALHQLLRFTARKS